MTDRATFEQHFALTLRQQAQHTDGSYRDPLTQARWEGYQAKPEAPAAPVKTWQERAAELPRPPTPQQAYELLQGEIDELRAQLAALVAPIKQPLINSSRIADGQIDTRMEKDVPEWERLQRGKQEPVQPQDIRKVLEWAYAMGAQFGEGVPAEEFFYGAEESGAIARRLPRIDISPPG